MKIFEILSPAPKSANFTADDIKALSRLTDVNAARAKAFVLISNKGPNQMNPEKVKWFANQLKLKRSTTDVVKMMYDLMLSGEGNSVLGSRYSTAKNSYRDQFKEDTDNIVYTGLARRQAQKNKTPYRYNDDIAEQIPKYDAVKRVNIPAGYDLENPNAVPYSKFEARLLRNDIANIVGIAPDGREVKISTTKLALATVLADAYNRGGFTDKDVQRVKFNNDRE